MLQQIGIETGESSFPPHGFLLATGEGRQLVSFKKNTTIFSQGDATQSVFFVHSGKVKLSVVASNGKEAILGIFDEHKFVGESVLARQLPRMSSAIAITDCLLMRIEKRVMALAIGQDPALATFFVRYLLERNIRHQEDLADQLFNSSEKRLARILTLLAESDKKGVSGGVVPKLSQGTLAEMIGTTRSRVSFFLNRFRELGLIHYNTGDVLHVSSSLLHTVLGEGNSTGRAGGWPR